MSGLAQSIGTRKSAIALARTAAMACSGLQHIRLASRFDYDFPGTEVLPAARRDVAAMACVEQDRSRWMRINRIDGCRLRASAEANRDVLWIMNGHCKSQIAARAFLSTDGMDLLAPMLDVHSDRSIEAPRHDPADRPRELGRAVGIELLDSAADFIARRRPEDD